MIDRIRNTLWWAHGDVHERRDAVAAIMIYPRIHAKKSENTYCQNAGDKEYGGHSFHYMNHTTHKKTHNYNVCLRRRTAFRATMTVETDMRIAARAGSRIMPHA